MNAQTTIKAEPTLAAAMAQAFGEIEAATKGANNQHFKSKYADLGAVVDAIKPALINHGLFFTQHPEPSAEGVCVETFLHHASGETLSLGKLFVPANKKDAQGFGSALTYARRYALMTAFGVPAEDDDGNAAAASVNNRQQRQVSSAPAFCTDEQRDLIAALAPGAGKDLGSICQAYRVQSIKELTEAQATKLIERLRQPEAVQ